MSTSPRRKPAADFGAAAATINALTPQQAALTLPPEHQAARGIHPVAARNPEPAPEPSQQAKPVQEKWSIRLPSDLLRDIRVYAVTHGLKQEQVAALALRAYLDQHPKETA